MKNYDDYLDLLDNVSGDAPTDVVSDLSNESAIDLDAILAQNVFTSVTSTIPPSTVSTFGTTRLIIVDTVATTEVPATTTVPVTTTAPVTTTVPAATTTVLATTTVPDATTTVLETTMVPAITSIPIEIAEPRFNETGKI